MNGKTSEEKLGERRAQVRREGKYDLSNSTSLKVSDETLLGSITRGGNENLRHFPLPQKAD